MQTSRPNDTDELHFTSSSVVRVLDTPRKCRNRSLKDLQALIYWDNRTLSRSCLGSQQRIAVNGDCHHLICFITIATCGYSCSFSTVCWPMSQNRCRAWCHGRSSSQSTKKNMETGRELVQTERLGMHHKMQRACRVRKVSADPLGQAEQSTATHFAVQACRKS